MQIKLHRGSSSAPGAVFCAPCSLLMSDAGHLLHCNNDNNPRLTADALCCVVWPLQ
jgi:hypothetical protein